MSDSPIDSDALPDDLVGEGDTAGDEESYVEAWKAQTKGIDRVISVAMTLGQPRTAKWVADEAHVSVKTAREHLDRLVELQTLTKTEAHGTTTFAPDEAYQRYRDVSRLAQENTQEELEHLVVRYKEDIEARRESYDVETPTDLRSRATEPDTTVQQTKEWLAEASQWELDKYTLSIIQEAMERKEPRSKKHPTIKA